MRQLNFKAILPASFILVLLYSCAHVPVDNNRITDTNRRDYIKNGISTKKDIYLVYGQPHDVLYDNAPGRESSWIYYKNTLSTSGVSYIPVIGLFIGGSNSKSFVATIKFDERDKVRALEFDDKYRSNNNTWTTAAKSLNQDQKSGRVLNEMAKFMLPFDEAVAENAKTLHIYSD